MIIVYIFVVIIKVSIVVVVINPWLEGTLLHMHLVTHLFVLIRQFTQSLLILLPLVQ